MMLRLINWEFTRGRVRQRTGSQHGETIKLGSQYSIMVRKLNIKTESKQVVSPPMICSFNARKKRKGNTIMIKIGCQEIIFSVS